MRKTIGSITAAMAVAQLALVALASPGLAAGAADDCLAKPNAAAPRGSHWYYRVERSTQRQCWYVGPAGKNVQRAERAAVAPPVTDTEADASATPPASPALRVEAAAAAPPAMAMPPQMTAPSRDTTAAAQSPAFGQRWSNVSVADAAAPVAAPQAADADTERVQPVDPVVPAPAAVSSAGLQVDPPAASEAEADQKAPSTAIALVMLVIMAISLGGLALGVRAAINAWLESRPLRRGADWSAGWTAERSRAPLGEADEGSLAAPLVPWDAPVRPSDAMRLPDEPIGLREAEADLARLLRSVRRQRAA